MIGVRSRLVACGLALAALTGCASQIDALGPVSGENRTTLRIATIDVLTAQGIAMTQVPVCEPVAETAGAYACSGTTVDGRPIEVTVPPGDVMTMTVTVDGVVVYEGPVDDVIDPSDPADE